MCRECRQRLPAEPLNGESSDGSRRRITRSQRGWCPPKVLTRALLTHLQNLYILAELGQRILAVMASKNSWPVQTYPGKIKLPADIFKALPSQEVQNEVCCDASHLRCTRKLILQGQLAKRNWLEPSVADAVLQSLKSSKSEGKVYVRSRKFTQTSLTGLHEQRKATPSASDRKSKSKRSKTTPTNE